MSDLLLQNNSRMLPLWVQDHLCRVRKEEYEKALKAASNTESDVDHPETENDRPYGISWKDQGVVEDIWWEILSYITETEDIINLFGVSDLFRHILRSRYIQVRLPDIVEICLKTCEKELIPEEELRKYEEPEDDEDGVWPPPKSPFLKLRSSLRLLSKLTRKSTDEVIHYKKGFDEGAKGVPETWIRSPEDVHEYIQKIDAAGIQNNGTFYPHSLRIQDNGMSETEMIPLLQRIGRSIWRIHYRADRRQDHNRIFENVYNILRSWVELTPNLEELKIQPSHAFYFENDGGRPEQIRYENVPPFPTWKKLNIFHDTFHFPMEFRAAIFRANPTIQNLKQKRERWGDHEWMYDFIKGFLPTATDAEEQVNLDVEEWVSMCTPPLCVIQPRLLFLMPKLKKLAFIEKSFLYLHKEPLIVSSTILFNFLNRFQTLEDVTLELQIKDDGGYLELPNLREFEWRVQRGFENLDFILPLEKLEYLYCRVGDYFRPEFLPRITPGPYTFLEEDIEKPREEMLHFFDGLKNKNFLDTKLKHFFPRLKEIRIIRKLSNSRELFDDDSHEIYSF